MKLNQIIATLLLAFLTATGYAQEVECQQTGVASFYADKFNGRKTASGERFDPNAMTAAHRTLSFGSLVAVTNLANGQEVVVRVNDRGPWGKSRILDVSYAAAKQLGMHRSGTAKVKLELLD